MKRISGKKTHTSMVLNRKQFHTGTIDGAMLLSAALTYFLLYRV